MNERLKEFAQNAGLPIDARGKFIWSAGGLNMVDYANPKVQERVMLEYLQLMIHRKDWHGVADAAMDLREMHAEKSGWQQPLYKVAE